MSQRIRSEPVRFWIAEETHKTVKRIAEAEGRTTSSVYRDLVEKGLVASGYRSDSKDLAALVRDTVEAVLQPQVERLASISAKGTQISAASFFIAAYSGKLAVPEHMQAEFDEIARMARKLGVEYLKLSRDKSLDDFIGRGLDRMGDDTL